MNWIYAAFLLLATGLGAEPYPMESYSQEVVIQFRSEAAASIAQVGLLPLYHGYEEAFSSRWDDNHMGDLKVREVMEAFGQKGTFFLNDSAGYHEPSQSGMTLPGEPGALMAKALLAGGNSIGAHSLAHEFVPYLSRNRQFYEVLGCRVDRELNSQSPVLAYAFSFLSIKNPLEGEASQRDLGEILGRSGFYHLSEHMWANGFRTEFLLGTLICGDGGLPSWSKPFEQELAAPREAKDKPLWVVSMHPWADAWGGPEFPLLKALYRKWSHKQGWWYCNQNEYAAYRWQFLHCPLEITREGQSLKIRLQRPEALDLNHPIPLSFALRNARAADIVGIRSGGIAIALQKTEAKGELFFDLSHASGHGVPTVFGSAALGAEASLLASSRSLKLTLRNTAGQPLSRIRVTFRLPLKYANGVQIRRLEALGPGESKSLEIPLALATTDPLYRSGRAYDVAQIDALREGIWVRAYATLMEVEGPRDASLPKGGFVVLGPLGSDKAAQAQAALQEGGLDIGWRIPAAELEDPLGAEIAMAGGKNNSLTFYTWDKSLHHPGPNPLHYVLWSRVQAERSGRWHAAFDKHSVLGIFLNGRNLDLDAASLDLKQGLNDLRIHYAAQAGPYSSFSPDHYGVWFRLTDAAGKRATGLSYLRPPVGVKR